MAGHRLPELFTESAVIVQPPAARRLTIPEPERTEVAVDGISTAGGEYLPEGTEPGLLWSIDAGVMPHG